MFERFACGLCLFNPKNMCEICTSVLFCLPNDDFHFHQHPFGLYIESSHEQMKFTNANLTLRIKVQHFTYLLTLS